MSVLGDPRRENSFSWTLASRRQSEMTADEWSFCDSLQKNKGSLVYLLTLWVWSAVVRTSDKSNKREVLVLKMSQALNSAGPAMCSHRRRVGSLHHQPSPPGYLSCIMLKHRRFGIKMPEFESASCHSVSVRPGNIIHHL